MNHAPETAPHSPAANETRSPYDRIGGEAGVRRLVERFYDAMDSAPEAAGIRAMHAADLAPMRQRLFEFLSGGLGGPRLYDACVMSAHRPFAIGSAESDAWMSCMRRAMADVGIEEDLRVMLDAAFARMAKAFQNS